MKIFLLLLLFALLLFCVLTCRAFDRHRLLYYCGWFTVVSIVWVWLLFSPGQALTFLKFLPIGMIALCLPLFWAILQDWIVIIVYAIYAVWFLVGVPVYWLFLYIYSLSYPVFT